MSERRPHVVLRSIVGPALGLSVSALVAAGSASGCASNRGGTTEPTAEPTSSGDELWVGLVSTADRVPEVTPSASASAAPSEMPKPGDIPPRPGTIEAPPKVGTMTAPPEDPGTWVGTTSNPGFSANGRVGKPSTVRPTRASRRVTDADASMLRGGRSSERPRRLY